MRLLLPVDVGELDLQSGRIERDGALADDMGENCRPLPARVVEDQPRVRRNDEVMRDARHSEIGGELAERIVLAGGRRKNLDTTMMGLSTRIVSGGSSGPQ